MNDLPPIFIGNQTAFSAATFLEPFEYGLANDFDAFEWFSDKKPNGAGWDGSDLSPGLRADIRNRAQARGMRLSVHAHCAANPLRPESLPVLWRDLELAEALGATLLNVHLFLDASIAAYAGALVPVLQRAAAAGLQVAIENTPETTPQHFNELFGAWQAMGLPAAARAGMCFDLGHANLCPATRNDYLRYFDQLASDLPIIHLHLHENRGDRDAHLPIFTGPAGVDARGIEGLLRRLRRRGYTGSFILEQWPQPPSLLIAARSRLRHMWQALGERPEAPPAGRSGEPR